MSNSKKIINETNLQVDLKAITVMADSYPKALAYKVILPCIRIFGS